MFIDWRWQSFGLNEEEKFKGKQRERLERNTFGSKSFNRPIKAQVSVPILFVSPVKQSVLCECCHRDIMLTSLLPDKNELMNSMQTCHSVIFNFMKKDSKRCSDTTTPESIHTKDESKRGSAFAFIFGVN